MFLDCTSSVLLISIQEQRDLLNCIHEDVTGKGIGTGAVVDLAFFKQYSHNRQMILFRTLQLPIDFPPYSMVRSSKTSYPRFL